MEEGYASVRGGRVWYKRTGKKQGAPLILVHGGPGSTHDYLEPLGDLEDEREIVFYDQLDCGNSDKTNDRSLWTLDRYADELSYLVTHFGYKRYHVYGQSWGTAVAIQFALSKPKGLLSLVLSDSLVSAPRWRSDAQSLLATLPSDDQEALRSGNVSAPGFEKAWKEYAKKYVIFLDPMPAALRRSADAMNYDVYCHMWGSSEFDPTGTLKDLDLTERLSDIEVPTLFLCGRNDEATPESAEHFRTQMKNARLTVFEHSAHAPFWTERDAYMQALRRFLGSAESADS